MNPKERVARRKAPIFSVVPPASVIYEAQAMRYGAYDAPREDGSLGYKPFNWRATGVTASAYVDAAIRHILDWWDGENVAPDSLVHHLAHAKATLGIIIDALENGVLEGVDNDPER